MQIQLWGGKKACAYQCAYCVSLSSRYVSIYACPHKCFRVEMYKCVRVCVLSRNNSANSSNLFICKLDFG